MNSINIAIVFAPTLLWPDSGLDVIKNEVPPLIQFMIEQSPRIFGQDIPDLYRLLSPPRSYRVPTKKTDGNLRVYRHRRNGSFDTSTSEDSAGEEDAPSNLLILHRSGLTVSDSQVSVLSQQLEDEEYEPALSQGARNVPHDGFHLLNLPSPRRQKKVRPPERSSSYRGPNERPPYVKRYHVQVDESRRKSIATQTTLQEGSKPRFATTLSQPLLSPTSSVSPATSHSQEVSSFMKSHQMQSFDENEEYNDEDDDLMIVETRPSQKRKRGKAPYRTAFSVDHLMKKSSNSEEMTFYDHLPPLTVKGQPQLPCDISVLGTHSNEGSFDTPMEDEDEEHTWIVSSLPLDSGPPPRPILSSSDRSVTTTNASNQSSSSSSSSGHYYSGNAKLTQSRPSNLSLMSNTSESSYASTITKTSPELERRPLSREMVKYEITKRFPILPRDDSFTGSTYSNGTGRSDSFNQDMIDNIQRKFQERKRPEALGSISSSSITPHSGMGSVSSPPSFDDRPESERHLNSLPRSEMGLVRSPPLPAVEPGGVVYRRARSSAAELTHREVEHDPNKLFVENNSDTESSPSRTLTRRDKLNEVTQRAGYYNSRYSRVSGSVGHGGTPGRTHRPYMTEITIVPTKKDGEQTRVASSKAALTQSLPPEPETKQTIVINTSPSIRPKSADGSGKAAVATVVEETEEEEEFRKRTMSDIEKAKLKLGLIPPRRRSKSISDTRSGKQPLLQDSCEGGEDDKHARGEFDRPREETETREVRVQAEKLNKRGMWRAHAPNSTDRKEAYTQRMRGSGGSVGTGFLAAAKSNVSTAVPPPAIQRTATAPEMGSKRRATTMPEYMATRSSAIGRQGRVLGRGLVRTVKITAYHIPEPRKIHRINLRTIH